MIDNGEIMACALDDFGEEAMVNGSAIVPPFMVLACLDDEAELDGEMVVRSGPFAIAAADRVASLELVAGNEGDTLTLRTIDYTVLAIDPDGLGGAVLSLLPEA